MLKKTKQLFYPYCPHMQGFCISNNLPCKITYQKFMDKLSSTNKICKYFSPYHPVTGNLPSLLPERDNACNKQVNI